MGSGQSEDSRLEQANTLGLEYLRTLILLNGGAILALFTFMGNASGDAAIQFSLSAVKCAMAAFVIAIVFMLISLVISYSYTATAPGHSYRDFWDKWIITINSLLGVASLALFVIGFFSLIIGATSQ
jgi:hypothetical protein